MRFTSFSFPLLTPFPQWNHRPSAVTNIRNEQSTRAVSSLNVAASRHFASAVAQRNFRCAQNGIMDKRPRLRHEGSVRPLSKDLSVHEDRKAREMYVVTNLLFEILLTLYSYGGERMRRVIIYAPDGKLRNLRKSIIYARQPRRCN